MRVCVSIINMNEPKRKVLIAEDNVELSDMARNYLMKDGYVVYQAFDGKQAIEMAKSLTCDLVLLDVMMPICDGFEVCRAIRAEKDIPIIVMSARSGEEDKLELLELGADDYITKPFSFKELVARVNAQMRRYFKFSAPVRQSRAYGNLVLYPEEMIAKVNGKEIPLTAKEFRLLDVLTLNEGRVFSKQKLIDEVWGPEYYIDENTVAVTINRLREKLKKEKSDGVETVWGIGYRWKKQ